MLSTHALNQADAESSTLENRAIALTVDRDAAAWTVLDKRNVYTWSQEVPKERWNVEFIEKNSVENTLRIQVADSRETLVVTIQLVGDEPELTATIQKVGLAPRAVGPQTLYPYPFTLPDDVGHFVQCASGDGVIWSLKEKERIKGLYQFGRCMPWYGVTDFNKGTMAILESFYRPHAVGICEFPLKVRHRFFTEGGYVAMARYYRQLVLGRGPIDTLYEKAKKNPRINVLKHGVEAYLWGTARSSELIHELRDAGIDQAMLMWDPNHPPLLEPGLVNEIAALGFTPGMYDLYNLVGTPRLRRESPNQGTTDRRFLFANSDYALKGEDGNVAAGPGKEGLLTCSEKQYEWASKRLSYELNRDPYQARFFDTMIVQVNPCYDKTHPVTYQESREYRKKIFTMARGMGQVVGSGEGISPDWAVPYVDFFEGALRMAMYTEREHPGDWSNHWKPTSMIGDLEPHPSEIALTLNEAYRIPLMELVYHDRVVSTWNWRYPSDREPELWWKRDLINILLGNMPLWNLSLDEWQRKKDQYVQSYEKIKAVRDKVGFEDMINHCWLTDDRRVQRADYANGYSVIVNFGDKSFRTQSGRTVEPQSYLLVEPGTENPSKSSDYTGIICGVWRIQSREILERVLDDNPLLDGLCTGYGWSQIEPKRGEFDWSLFDNAVEAAKERGKFVSLAVEPGTESPDWVYEAGAQEFRFEGKDGTMRMPVPWDPVYQIHWTDLVRAFGKRYAENPTVRKVQICGVNQYNPEMHLPKEPADMQQWNQISDGRLHERIVESWKKCIDLYMDSFHHCLLTIDASPCLNDKEIPQQVIAYGAQRYPARFGMQVDSLNGRDDQKGFFVYDLLESYADKIHTGHQELSSFHYHVRSANRPMGDKEMFFHNLNQAKAKYLELWYADGCDQAFCEEIAKRWSNYYKRGQ
ncbi:MAG: DUF5696 domain-containing protein [Candidatus Sumerlaeota bacterium]|nr:DUF5696 domain-containing protein [Candidatus Sumerlaeota bacterium]